MVSVDHNKPIIVPSGQDSFQQIGELNILSHPLSVALSILTPVDVFVVVLTNSILCGTRVTASGQSRHGKDA